MEAVLESWCQRKTAANGGCVRATRPRGLQVSGPYLLPKEGEDPVYLDCRPLEPDKAPEARDLLFKHDPTAEEFVQNIEGCTENASTRDRLDLLCYMSAVLENKDKLEELVSVKEYVEKRKRARVEADESMGVNSPRMVV